MSHKKELNEIGFLGTNASAIVTNSDRRKTIIKNIILHNIDTTNDYKVYLYIVKSGETASDSKRFASPTVKAEDTAFVEISGDGLIMSSPGKSLQAKAEVADKITIHVMGEVE